jgi:hypothetical protein
MISYSQIHLLKVRRIQPLLIVWSRDPLSLWRRQDNTTHQTGHLTQHYALSFLSARSKQDLLEPESS